MGNIILCGFMGCGKTTVGNALAQLSRRPLVDTDALIIQEAGISINEIFSRYGESHFRDLEHKICCNISSQDELIVSTGGGALTYERNAQALKLNGGKIFLLDVPVEIIEERLRNDTTRPLLNVPNRREILQKLYHQRLPLYRACADYIIDASLSPQDTALNIMQLAGIS